MTMDRRLYGNEFNPKALRNIKEIHEKIETESDPESITRLNMLEMMSAMEIGMYPCYRNWKSYFPY